MNDQYQPDSDDLLLADADATPALFGLTHLAERPDFRIDRESETMYALLDDLNADIAIKAAPDKRPRPVTELDADAAS
jgi:hypothetical protein